MENNDKGYTLIELIVVIAIMVILMAMLFIGLAVLPSTAAKGCANGIKTFVGQTRIMTMGKRETVLEIYRDSNDRKYYAVEYSEGINMTAPEECGRSNITVSYHVQGSPENLTDSDLSAATYTDLAPGQAILITFDRGNGTLKAMTGLSVTAHDGSTNASALYDCIKVSGGGSDYYVRIYPATGKVVLN